MSPLNMSAIYKEGMFTKETLCIWFFFRMENKRHKAKGLFSNFGKSPGPIPVPSIIRHLMIVMMQSHLDIHCIF